MLERQVALWNRRVEPVVVAWDGAPPTISLRLPSDLASSTIRCSLGTEAGRNYAWKVPVDWVAGSTLMEGFVNGRIDLGDLFEANDLPTGYHRLTLEFEDGQAASTLLISASTRAYQGADAGGKRPWGVFCPLYALHRETSWGAGDFSDLEALIDWTSAMGGGLVASLPMLASNFDGPSPTHQPLLADFASLLE